MTEQIQKIIINKILENSSIFINKLEMGCKDLTAAGRASAINFSAAITLNMIFSDDDFNNSEDLTLILQKLSDEIELRKTKKYEDNYFLFENATFAELLDTSNNNFSNLKITPIILKKEIVSLKQEFLVSLVLNSTENSFLFFNTLISLYISPFINSNEENLELFHKIQTDLKKNSLFMNAREEFSSLIYQSMEALFNNNAHDEAFVSAIKLYKNRNKEILNTGKETNNKNCYVATLVYEDIEHPNVEFLRNFRDNTLMQNYFGKLFIRVYYLTSPKLVIILKPYKKIQKFIKIILDKFIFEIKNQQ